MPVEGRYFDGGFRFGPAVNVLMHVVDGYILELDIYKDDGSAIRIGPFAVPLTQVTVSANRGLLPEPLDDTPPTDP